MATEKVKGSDEFLKKFCEVVKVWIRFLNVKKIVDFLIFNKKSSSNQSAFKITNFRENLRKKTSLTI